ncbi:MAG: 30S ribosomal protein S20 [Ectothiorhodospiraceae bacterium]|nr:30S ribosomal protein S20 [Ectothiorhodospiraceae bacterium]
MANHKSAIKRIRVSETRRLRNMAKKTRMKNLIKQLQGAETREQAEALYKQVSSHLDRIAEKGIIHKNNAANRKSKLAKFVQSLSA